MKPQHLTLFVIVFGLASVAFSGPDRVAARSLFEGDLSHWNIWLARPAHTPRDTPPLGLNQDPGEVFTIVAMEGRPALRISREYLDGLTSNSGEWNTLELVCWEDGAAHYVNGRLVLVLTGSRRIGADGSATPLTGGLLQIQTEGAELFVRDIEWESLAEAPPELVER